MTIKPLHTLLLASGLLTPLAASAVDKQPGECKPDQVWISFMDHKACYAKGDKAPDKFTREELAYGDWKKHGFTAPGEGDQWVKSGNHYLLINRENGVIREILDAHGKVR